MALSLCACLLHLPHEPCRPTSPLSPSPCGRNHPREPVAQDEFSVSPGAIPLLTPCTEFFFLLLFQSSTIPCAARARAQSQAHNEGRQVASNHVSPCCTFLGLVSLSLALSRHIDPWPCILPQTGDLMHSSSRSSNNNPSAGCSHAAAGNVRSGSISSVHDHPTRCSSHTRIMHVRKHVPACAAALHARTARATQRPRVRNPTARPAALDLRHQETLP